MKFIPEPFSSELNDGQHIFVFGSNLRGLHGLGAALTALKYWGAVAGVASGRMGSSYALPTKDQRLKTLPVEDVHRNVQEFLRYARSNPFLTFLVTRVGCGLAGLKDEHIAPMFAVSPSNCVFSEAWRQWL